MRWKCHEDGGTLRPEQSLCQVARVEEACCPALPRESSQPLIPKCRFDAKDSDSRPKENNRHLLTEAECIPALHKGRTNRSFSREIIPTESYRKNRGNNYGKYFS